MGIFGFGPGKIDAGIAAAKGIYRLKTRIQGNDHESLTDDELKEWAEENGFSYRKEDGVTYLKPETDETEQIIEQYSNEDSEFPDEQKMLEPGLDIPAREFNNSKGESTMTEDISVKYDGTHEPEGALGNTGEYKNLEVDLRQVGGQFYRENNDIYSDIDDPEREDAVIQSTGAALLLEEALKNDNVQENMDELIEIEEYMTEQGLRDEFNSYKEGLAEGALPDKAAGKVVGLLNEFEEYAKTTESLTTLNNAASQEAAQHMLNYAESLREITHRASDINVDDFDAPERLADNLQELGRKESRLSDIDLSNM